MLHFHFLNLLLLFFIVLLIFSLKFCLIINYFLYAAQQEAERARFLVERVSWNGMLK